MIAGFLNNNFIQLLIINVLDLHKEYYYIIFNKIIIYIYF